MSNSAPVRLQLIIPFHQPLTATDAELSQACDTCYLPLLDAIESFEDIRLSLYFSGYLLDFLARKREDFLLRLKSLHKRGQIEVLGGLFYGGQPALLPESDIRGQLEMSGEFWESFLGVMPKGFWLSDLAWTPELPRLFDETTLEFGFISDSQLDHAKPPSMGLVERGGLRLPAFVLHRELSTSLPSMKAAQWLADALKQAQTMPHQLISAWVRAESLGLEPGTEAWCHRDGWLQQWFIALTEQQGLELMLPSETLSTLRPAEPLRLRHMCAPELLPLGLRQEAIDWTDFPFMFNEVDTLYRRMLRASEKLREAIAMMEDERLEDTWSDVLATAQRLIFSAQAPDVYWRGARPGFTDPALRDATLERVLRAENLLDGVLQEDDDWLATEEHDLDGDFDEEVIVSTRHIGAWLVPARGGEIRSIDDRMGMRTLLDTGVRRDEPFFAEMREAPAASVRSPLQPRGKHLPRLAADLPHDVDKINRRGMRQVILAHDADPQGLINGSLADSTPSGLWDVTANGIDEEGDCSYTLSLERAFAVNASHVRVQKHVHVPIDRASLQQSCSIAVEQGAGVLWAAEIPLRVSAQTAELWVNGKRHEGDGTQASDVAQVRYEAQDGESVELRFTPAVNLHWSLLRTTVRDLDGYRPIPQGVVLIPWLRVTSSLDVTVELSVTPRII